VKEGVSHVSVELIELVAKELKQKTKTVEQVIHLLDEGNTVPFIARYRKEATGGLDEVEIKNIQDRWTYAVQLSERKEEVIRLIDEQEKLTDELEKDILAATKLQRVEDLYRPYKQKRRTRATIAKEKGLEPLAELVWKQDLDDLATASEAYFSEEHELHHTEHVLAGVNDILAEWISDDPKYRDFIREMTWKEGMIQTEVKQQEKDDKEIYKMYYEYTEAVKSLVSHRILAINRGEKEDVLKVSIEAPTEKIQRYLTKQIMKDSGTKPCVEVIQHAIEDGYKRLIQPSVEREIRSRLTETAEVQAISVFSENLRNLLLQPPLKGRMILGVDPAFRTGCKLAVIDETGKMYEIGVIFPTAPRNDVAGAEKKVLQMIDKYKIELVAIGNGTASRETEQFIADTMDKHQLQIPYIIVNEAGASVYSASKLAREEFPDLEVEERSAVSIARRV